MIDTIKKEYALKFEEMYLRIHLDGTYAFDTQPTWLSLEECAKIMGTIGGTIIVRTTCVTHSEVKRESTT